MRAKPKKSLGQNFLQDPNIRRKIITSCGFSKGDIVLEIGPGQAAMTGLIAEQVKKLVAVEIDRELSSELQARFSDDPRISIITADILQYDLSEITPAPNQKIKVFGNIPYYITSPIIEHLFLFRHMISEIYLTVQKEFGQRVVAKPGTEHYGSFSCFVQYHALPSMEFVIKRTCFFPAPNVDSCLLKLGMRSSPAVCVADEDLFFRIIRASFQKRRKTLRNCLKSIIPEDKLADIFAACNIDPNIRGEMLGIDEFGAIANKAKKELAHD